MCIPIKRQVAIMVAWLLLSVVPGSVFGQEVSVLLTADAEGQIGPCIVCPEDSGRGGLAQLATLISQHRQQHPTTLVISAGNAFFGPESLASHGRVILEAYKEMEYDIVHLSARDFRLGKEATVKLIRQAPFR